MIVVKKHAKNQAKVVFQLHLQSENEDFCFTSLPGSNWCFSFAPGLVGYLAHRDLHRRAAY